MHKHEEFSQMVSSSQNFNAERTVRVVVKNCLAMASCCEASALMNLSFSAIVFLIYKVNSVYLERFPFG